MLPPPHPTRQGAEQDSSDPGPSQVGGDGRKTWLWEGSTGSSAVSVSRCADLKLDETHSGSGYVTLGLESFD